MASVGFAVGLGNIWRFPYITGENGGAAFVLIYLLCAYAIGVPCLIAELMIGRRGGSSAPKSVEVVARESGRSPIWSWIGGMGVFTAFTISVVYAVVVGWVLKYLFSALSTGFAGVDAAAANQSFSNMLDDSSMMLLWTVVGTLITGGIIFAGVKDGIERAVTVMMPVMFVLLIGLGIYNAFTGGFMTTLEWLFTPDFSKVDGSVVLAAVGQAFFSLSIAMGGMMTYGSYLPKDFSIVGGAALIVFADTMVALLAGFVVFPMVFHFGLDMSSGAGLIFQTLPVAFAQMPGGHVFSVFFFLMLAFAGITSLVGLLESVTAWFDERFDVNRHLSVAAVVLIVTVCSIASVLSYNVWSEVRIAGMNFNDIAEDLPGKVLLPLGGLMIAVFAGWRVLRTHSEDELNTNSTAFVTWRALVRYLVVPAIAVILVSGLI
ncbi:sodium:neurotransmitter symporter [Luminiphilus syltensis NOR5-1B]|uniref:Transporter n=2 Tax=Luminiphilus TaxID=1341118 RepID=B8KQL7_9GAMM|nr:sodium:neurotransmitter symporter [Luminiphilus syltensis NOR5-1B]